MEKNMSLKSRQELRKCVYEKYTRANKKEKIKILDGFVAATGYERKYAIRILRQNKYKIREVKKSRERASLYDESVYRALLTTWYAANKICSKRLVPFLPDLVEILEKCGHLVLTPIVKEKLLKISASTVDRLLKREKPGARQSIKTTQAGQLLKNQIKIRTFKGWDDAVPGFVEGDLVAHCGDNVSGSFLNTLTLTDIATTWTECLPLLKREEGEVISALKIAQKLFPFSLLGLDTDNGSEFINYALLEFCKEQHITFTRSRAYQKNDQAHVEEKNGSIVRRLVGYDRYEGKYAWETLAELYATLRLYVNFFQPSMKLANKQRQKSKVKKTYEKAQTPYQRVMLSPHVQESLKSALKIQYERLNPVELLESLKKSQEKLATFAWKKERSIDSVVAIEKKNFLPSPPAMENDNHYISSYTLVKQGPLLNHYSRIKKPRKPLASRTWRTRKDPFEGVWLDLKLHLQLNPHLTARNLLDSLIKKYPEKFCSSHLRTLQRRIMDWKKETWNAVALSDQLHISSARETHFLSLAQNASA